jgi:type II secretory pathway pseudopilin PulG
MTLLELVLVTALVSLLAFAMIPRFAAVREVELETAARQVAADLRYAQSQAIAQRVRHGVVFDLAAERYTVYRGDPSTPAPDFLRGGAPLRRGWDGVDLAAAVFGATSAVEFNSLGAPCDGAGGELAVAGVVVLAGASRTDTVRVHPLTGRVEF